MASPLSVLKSTMYSMHAYPPAPLSTASSTSSAGGGDPATHELLARQLSVQMDYCNDLLAQVQKLEEQQLVSQRAISDKGGQLRQALAITEAARGEAADAKRKLALTQVRAGRDSGQSGGRLPHVGYFVSRPRALSRRSRPRWARSCARRAWTTASSSGSWRRWRSSRWRPSECWWSAAAAASCRRREPVAAQALAADTQ
jgi:hypothetical protein